MSAGSLNGAEKIELRLSIHDSIHLIHKEDWEGVARKAALYMQYEHLCALEDVMAGSMQFRYVIFYCQQFKPIGIAYFQALDLVDNGSTYRDAVRKLGAGIGARIVKEFKVRSLVCGNAFHCGTHGVKFLKGVDVRTQLAAFEMAIERSRSDERLKPKASVLLFKELWPEQFKPAEVLQEKGYHPLEMDVNMVMDIRPEWLDLKDHLEALTSKSRTRMKSILSRSAELVIKDLSAAEIRTAAPVMQGLFDQVLESAPFIFGRLNVEVYASWKELHKNKMMFHGFYLNDKLVGFNSAFHLGDTLDAQFVGIDYSVNKEHMIYQRMLIDLLEHAIHHKMKKINFGRTAEQAKSNIGALPVPMLFYVKHRNRLANKIIGPFMRGVRSGPYELRSPFKEVHAK